MSPGISVIPAEMNEMILSMPKIMSAVVLCCMISPLRRCVIARPSCSSDTAGRHEPRSAWREGVESFSAEPLPVLTLDLPRAHIVEYHESRYIPCRVPFLYHRAFPADDHGKFSFGVDILDARPYDDIIVRPAQSGHCFCEEHGMFGRFAALFKRVPCVVEAEADDLARHQDGRVELERASGKKVIPVELGGIVHEIFNMGDEPAAEYLVDRRGQHRIGRVDIEDAVAYQRSGPRPVFPEGDEFHLFFLVDALHPLEEKVGTDESRHPRGGLLLARSVEEYYSGHSPYAEVPFYPFLFTVYRGQVHLQPDEALRILYHSLVGEGLVLELTAGDAPVG